MKILLEMSDPKNVDQARDVVMFYEGRPGVISVIVVDDGYKVGQSTETVYCICDRCKGSGKIEKFEVEDYHNNIKKYWEELCPKCGGFGRVKETTIKRIEKIDEKDIYLKRGVR